MVISTGKSDWEKEVTEASDSLALYLAEQSHKTGGKERKDKGGKGGDAAAASLPGLCDPRTASKIIMLNGSHNTVCDDSLQETVLVLPDYKVVTGVPRTSAGAQDLWKYYVDPKLPRASSAPADSHLKSWVLPYSCVILLCTCIWIVSSTEVYSRNCLGSHKRRDNRCAIAAPKLEHGTLMQYAVLQLRDSWI